MYNPDILDIQIVGCEYCCDSGNSAGLDTWWKKLLLVLGIVGVFMLVIAVIGGIFSLLAPILVPLILVIIVFRIIGSRR